MFSNIRNVNVSLCIYYLIHSFIMFRNSGTIFQQGGKIKIQFNRVDFHKRTVQFPTSDPNFRGGQLTPQTRPWLCSCLYRASSVGTH